MQKLLLVYLNRIAMKFDQYTELRASGDGIISYGLFRRSSQLISLVEREISEGNLTKLRIVDFGCYDGAMMTKLSQRYSDICESAIGFDIFPHGQPEDIEEHKIRFIKWDLHQQMPYPLEDASQNLLIAAAFFKHHRSPEKFLRECDRILSKDGVLIMLDPRSWVVRIGFLFKYFIKKDNPNLWDKSSVEDLIAKCGLENSLEISRYEPYWVAPNKKLFDIGLENLMPGFLKRFLALHQSIVIKKR